MCLCMPSGHGMSSLGMQNQSTLCEYLSVSQVHWIWKSQCGCICVPVFTGPVCVQGMAGLHWAWMYSGYGWSSLGRNVFRVWPVLTGSACIQGVACLHWACMYSGYGLSSLCLYVFRVWPVFTVPVCIQGMACMYSGCDLYVFRVWPVFTGPAARVTWTR